MSRFIAKYRAGAVAAEFRRVAVIAVQRNAIDLVVALLQHLSIPGEISRHARVARTASDELQIGIDHANLRRGIAGFATIFASGQPAHLPGAIHFVAHAPVAHVVRLFISVLAAQVAPLRASIEIAILDILHGLFDRARAEIETQQWLACQRAGTTR